MPMPAGAKDAALAKSLNQLHERLAWLLTGLVAVHDPISGSQNSVDPNSVRSSDSDPLSVKVSVGRTVASTSSPHTFAEAPLVMFCTSVATGGVPCWMVIYCSTWMSE